MNSSSFVLKPAILSMLFSTGLTACNSNSILGTQDSNQTSSSKAAFIEIQNGMTKTNDTVLKLRLSSELSNTSKMKISFDKACGGGDWEEYNPNLKVASPKVNTATAPLARLSMKTQIHLSSVKPLLRHVIAHPRWTPMELLLYF